VARLLAVLLHGLTSVALISSSATDGRIAVQPLDVASPEAAGRARGEWVDARGALPAARGHFDPTRVR
jgi:hypothetical protein